MLQLDLGWKLAITQTGNAFTWDKQQRCLRFRKVLYNKFGSILKFQKNFFFVCEYSTKRCQTVLLIAVLKSSQFVFRQMWSYIVRVFQIVNQNKTFCFSKTKKLLSVVNDKKASQNSILLFSTISFWNLKLLTKALLADNKIWNLVAYS